MTIPRELDSVVLKRDLVDSGLETGDIGTVVHVYKPRTAFEVEFITGKGSTVAVLTLEKDDIRLLGGRDILHARVLGT